MDQQAIRQILARQRDFFAAGRTRELAFRLDQLRRLKQAIQAKENVILRALGNDLGKPAYEAYGGDVAVVVREIDHALWHLRSWARPRATRTPLVNFPARCSVVPEPYGVALIIGPWNFPVQLTLSPLAAALAAGNCVIVKPSPLTPATTAVIRTIIEESIPPGLVSVIEGGAETAQALLEERVDYIFFTGGTATGRLVMQAASKHLIPVTLELGGKNPCIVAADADLDVTARRIVWGKFFNAGQSCVAVDYLLVDRSVKDRLLDRIAGTIRRFYGDDPATSPDFARIINADHADRLARLLTAGRLVTGGTVDRAARYIAPTIIDGIRGDEPVMEDEIFGPILPVIAWDDLDDAITFVNRRPDPLALYLFSRDRRTQDRVLARTASGGACVNDTVVHFLVTELPFGGVGDSGMGKYHGKAGFDTFSHERSIVRRGFLPDFLLRYPPYRDHLRIFRKLF
jgi:acyl-CoA reductase-like NAD-dependent aldehyde dehydrogenase